ncbi:MAG: type III-A CRISPR-associated protein Cas10/Csm1 [Tepidanaerobacteraceae bacterium]|jgi:CRISPR-associated protein Csm1|nr:type III-A CRISPR-associated protein Cas10/Csm1 [Tepidanaerobacteraceae bacterium]
MAFLHKAVTRQEVLLFLSSILHDIGKFYQRCNDKDVWHDVKKKYKTFYEEEGARGPRHQKWGAYFCEKVIREPAEVAGMVRNHHRPESLMEYIVAAADRLSAGERVKADVGEESSEPPKQLISVLGTISLDGERAAKDWYKRLEPFSAISFSTDIPEENPSVKYGELWSKFEDDINKIKNFIDPVELMKLYYILEEYTFNVPSAFYHSKPDISLWAHLKSTAAIAFAMYREISDLSEHQALRVCTQITGGNVQEDSKPLFCLVKGDISGIQDFVYDVAMDGATKSLRGRSFYISYLLRAVACYILKKERIPVTNIIYSGGGHFYLLMPGSFLNRIDEYQRELDEIFFDFHGGKLCLLIDGVSVSARDLSSSNFSPRFDEAGKIISRKKYRKFFSLIEKDKEAVFGPFEDSDSPCPHCGRPVDGNEECGYCKSFAETGEDILRKKYIVERWDDIPKNEGKDIRGVFRRLGLNLAFSDEPQPGFCYALKNDDVDFGLCCGSLRIAAGMRITREGNIVTFDSMADSSKGIKVWGVIRGDVDSLGRIFKDGLGENRSIARVMTLSQELSQFFGPYLEKIIEEADFKDCAMIYAGGDDFFFVGAWDRLLYLAYAIRQRFLRFTGFNPALTLSISFSMAPDKKFPLYRVASTAGERLEEAKSHERFVNGRRKLKDSLSFEDCVLGWEDFEKFNLFKTRIVEALENKVPRSILNILYSAVVENDFSREKNDVFRAWRTVYHLSRLKERHKEAKRIIDDIKDLVLEKGNTLYKYCYEAARWAEFETRK